MTSTLLAAALAVALSPGAWVVTLAGIAAAFYGRRR